ncbi:hypothetical protein, partial [Collinsella bouchesdurhonensis]|uniref:hypothetical protein n=1 Tax=Collinsella bouchesdurhonensis TaxID=1907654 RepID=UPI003565F3B8
AFRRVPEIQGLYPKSKPPLLGVVLIGAAAGVARSKRLRRSKKARIESCNAKLFEIGTLKQKSKVDTRFRRQNPRIAGG